MKGRKNFQPFVALICGVAILCCWIAPTIRAQEPSPSPAPTTQAVNKVELHQALLDLTNPFTVMCVAAHPDDEDGTTLTVLRRKYGVHTVSLFSTYGEGGQNAVGPELYEQLGVIRAQETRKAALIQGSEPYFLGIKDFGFSKSAEEAFKVWGHDEALRRMVLKIRELRPNVIITNHDTSRGHGHHQATGQLIIEAFDAAADPKRFPEQLAQLKPWQPQRLFVRVFGGSNAENKTESPKQVVAIDPNEVDPVRGTSFAEQALKALQQHATQGPWPKSMEEMLRARRVEAGKLPLIRYQLVRAAPGAPPLDNGSPSLLGGLKVPESISQRIVPAKIDGRDLTEFLDQPDRVLDALIKQRVSNSVSDRGPQAGSPLGVVESPSDDPHRVRLLEARLNKAMALAAGVSLTVNSGDPVLVPGIKTTFAINLANAGDRPVQIKSLSFDSWGKQSRLNTAEQLLADSETSASVEKTTPATAAFTVPKEDHLYDGSVSGQSSAAEAELEIEGARFLLSAETTLDVVPAVEIERISPSPCVRTQETLGHCKVFNVKLTNHLATPFRGVMKIDVANRSRATREVTRQLVLGPHESRDETVRDSNSNPRRLSFAVLRNSASVVISIHHPDSRPSITERSVPVVFSDARVVPDVRVGYVPSFDETLERSLAALGVEAKPLTVGDVQNADLSSYNTIIIDNRGYEAHPELIAANSRLLDFANAGGTLIVFYHKDNEWNPDPKKNRPQLAPYPIILGGERVTDETAPITFTEARHPLLNYPNKIGPADFKNWIQERGLYYPREWDAHYNTLFSTNDASEKPLKGGLLAAKYGKGNYIYTSMVWYRQLRSGVPGAYRMFANMISYGHR
ncbi:MAG: PIG-L family deacetylase [Acidobacteriota bacterium]|nr:PIG-L family deacetylase [Acidobacteriota bacterium]